MSERFSNLLAAGLTAVSLAKEPRTVAAENNPDLNQNTPLNPIVIQAETQEKSLADLLVDNAFLQETEMIRPDAIVVPRYHFPLRRVPGQPGAEQVAMVGPDDELTVIRVDAEEDWALVKTKNGTRGWARTGSLLEKKTPKTNFTNVLAREGVTNNSESFAFGLPQQISNELTQALLRAANTTDLNVAFNNQPIEIVDGEVTFPLLAFLEENADGEDAALTDNILKQITFMNESGHILSGPEGTTSLVLTVTTILAENGTRAGGTVDIAFINRGPDSQGGTRVTSLSAINSKNEVVTMTVEEGEREAFTQLTPEFVDSIVNDSKLLDFGTLDDTSATNLAAFVNLAEAGYLSDGVSILAVLDQDGNFRIQLLEYPTVILFFLAPGQSPQTAAVGIPTAEAPDVDDRGRITRISLLSNRPEGEGSAIPEAAINSLPEDIKVENVEMIDGIPSAYSTYDVELGIGEGQPQWKYENGEWIEVQTSRTSVEDLYPVHFANLFRPTVEALASQGYELSWSDEYKGYSFTWSGTLELNGKEYTSREEQTWVWNPAHGTEEGDDHFAGSDIASGWTRYSRGSRFSYDNGDQSLTLYLGIGVDNLDITKRAAFDPEQTTLLVEYLLDRNPDLSGETLYLQLLSDKDVVSDSHFIRDPGVAGDIVDSTYTGAAGLAENVGFIWMAMSSEMFGGDNNMTLLTAMLVGIEKYDLGHDVDIPSFMADAANIFPDSGMTNYPLLIE